MVVVSQEWWWRKREIRIEKKNDKSKNLAVFAYLCY